MFKAFYHPSFGKALKKLHPLDQDKVERTVNKIIEDPQGKSLNIKKLVNTTKSYRSRVANLDDEI